MLLYRTAHLTIYTFFAHIVKCTVPAISVYSLAPVIFRANSLDQ